MHGDGQQTSKNPIPKHLAEYFAREDTLRRTKHLAEYFAREDTTQKTKEG